MKRRRRRHFRIEVFIIEVILVVTLGIHGHDFIRFQLRHSQAETYTTNQ